MNPLRIAVILLIVFSCAGPDSKMVTVAQSHYEKGMAALEKKDLITAEAELKKAVDKNGKHIRARTALGDVYLEWRRFDESEKQYRAALNIDKNNDGPYVGLAKLYLDKKDVAQAARNIRNALKINDNNDEAHYTHGRIKLALDDTDAAAGAFKRTLEINPQHASAQTLLKRILVDQQPEVSPIPDISAKKQVTRAELSHLLYTGLKLDERPAITHANIRDIKRHRYQREIQHMTDLELMRLSDSAFHPDRNVTRAELAHIAQELVVLESGDPDLRSAFSETFSPFDDVTSAHPDYNAILLAFSYGLMETSSDGSFRPTAQASGAEVSIFYQKVKEFMHIK
ncbi:MAG: S-layer homology domain-containing protein [candidate division KSB1 bacterium]|jgi:tetratricopeptide (TPR) repeat protein|nr:S-layer homology domain-containing protein [candidate division KSB1 bacterium]